MATPISLPKGYVRLGNFPLDQSSVFATYTQLEDYVQTNLTAYAGQVCSVQETGKAYVIQSDFSILEIGAGDGGSVQVNSDWNATTGLAEILNKPSSFPASSHSHDLADLNQSTATQGQVVTWDGSNWVPQSPPSGTNADWSATSGSAEILNKPTLATVATTGSYTDLANKPTLGSAAATDSTAYATSDQGLKADSASQPGHLHSLANITQSAATTGQVPTWSGTAWVPGTPSGNVTSVAGKTGAVVLASTDISGLATVATTGSYTDLTNKPTLGTAAATDSTAYATSAQGLKADTASQPGHTHDASAIATGTIDVARLPVLTTTTQIVSNNLLTTLTTTEQNSITSGALVTTSDGNRWIYRSGTKTLESSYIKLADITPEWSTIANKPTTFTPSTHSHAISEVTGLQTALDSKQPSGSYATAAQGTKADTASQPGHTHALSNLTQSSATVGQVATWNGTAWVPQNPTGGSGASGDAVLKNTSDTYPVNYIRTLTLTEYNAITTKDNNTLYFII